MVRKAVTFGKEQPGREKLNCFSLSACCSKALELLPVICREKCGVCAAVSDYEGGDQFTPVYFLYDGLSYQRLVVGTGADALVDSPGCQRKGSSVTIG